MSDVHWVSLMFSWIYDPMKVSWVSGVGGKVNQ